MKRYFVAKTPTSDFVGLLPIEDIVSLLKSSKITGDFVATEASGPAAYLTYPQLAKRTDIQWEAVSQLLTHEVLPEPSASPAEESQGFSNVARYRDAYLVARATASIGYAVKNIGIGLGLVIVLGAVIAATQTQGIQIAAILFGGVLVAAVVGVPLFVLGILVAAQGQILKATLDSAVHTSPFLQKQDMAKIMSL